MVEIPNLKKKIGAFLRKEDGQISKESLIKTGLLLSGVALASLKSASAECGSPPANTNWGHCNELNMSKTVSIVKGTHNHGHANHSSHGSHGNCGCRL